MVPSHQARREKIMKRIIMVGLAVIGIGVVGAQAGGLACAIDEALQQKGSTYLEWTGHKFQMGPVDMIDKDKKTHVLSGTLVYVNGKKGKQSDETIAYRITKDGGAVKGIEIQTNSGMWLPLSPDMMNALGDYRKTGNIDQDKQGTIHQALYKAGEKSKDSWTKTAELIVAFIAIRHC
jgi:hypothetical protein